jgi:hypothetical protein
VRRRVQPLKGDLMKSSITNVLMALGLIAIGVGIAAAGIYIGKPMTRLARRY